MHAILIAIGSSGDVHPLIGIGVALRDRGHRVTLVTSSHFEALIQRAGLAFIPLGTVEDYHKVVSNPDLTHPRKGTELVIQECCVRPMRDVYAIIEEQHRPGETVVVSCGLGIGARIAHEKLGVPLITTQVQPMVFRSAYRTPVFGWLPMPQSAPKAIKRLVFRLLDVYADRLIAPTTNEFRAELGLAPVARIFNDWWMSPQLVLGLFPDWFGPVQPDWPPQTRLTGFPLYDESDSKAVPEDVKAFLDQGEAPIVFTPGSAMPSGRAFFEASVEACGLLGRRGILLTRYRDHVPPRLPASVRHFDYVPLGALLPQAAAMIHHGGVGTIAQVLRAGLPHLVMPMVNDQPDNASRLLDLGVAAVLGPKAYRGRAVADSLDRLLSSPKVETQCRSLAAKLATNDARAAACDAIERLGDGAI